MSKTELQTVAEQVSADYDDADVLIYIGPVHRPKDDVIIDACAEKKSRTNALLYIATFGGDPDAAYRITRALQRHYCSPHCYGDGSGELIVFVDSVCASAGTLIALGQTDWFCQITLSWDRLTCN